MISIQQLVVADLKPVSIRITKMPLHLFIYTKQLLHVLDMVEK